MNKKLDRMGISLETVKEEFINKQIEKKDELVRKQSPRMYNGPIRKNSLLSNSKLDGLGAGLGQLQPHISPVSSKRLDEIVFVSPHWSSKRNLLEGL